MSVALKGKKLSEETKEKMRKPKQKVICPYCHKECGVTQMKRWHFDNCKNKKE
jgi:anaerobic selenocysteine-containing dehydrogenase